MFKLLFFIFILFSLNRSSIQFDELEEQELNGLENLEKILNENGVSLVEMLQEVQAHPKPIIEGASLFNFQSQPDLKLDPEGMIRYRGYDYEEHYAITEDCYILTLNRIVNQDDPTPNKPPVLLQHGILDSATGFLINTLGGRYEDNDYKNLGFALAKRGFDVWLGNFRGNTYSLKHKKFSKFQPRYWKWTYDNHALQDLPAEISYIQNATGFDQIAYVGYSQGTTTMFELLSLKPEVEKALSAYVALAPVTYAGNLQSPVKYLAKFPGVLRLFLNVKAPFLPSSLLFKIVLALSCRSLSGVPCEEFNKIIFGYTKDQIDNSRLPVYFNHLPAGTSIPNAVRFGQLVKNGKFEMLDYMSKEKNLKCYNQTTPLKIPLGDITMSKMFIMNALRDTFGNVKDLEIMKSEIKSNPLYKTVEYDDFNHLDFLLSKNADIYVNQYVWTYLENNLPVMGQGLKLKQYNLGSCNLPDPSDHCHMNLEYVLNNIIDK